VTLECIHGFDEGMCDSCFPKKAPEQKAAPRRTPPRTAGSSIPRGTPGPGGSSGPGNTAGPSARPPVKKPLDLGAQRIFHVTHISNLAAIFDAGAITADAAATLDVSSPVTRELRRTATVNAGQMVADFVPFYLSPNATNWLELRTGASGVHWSDAARTATATDFVVLAGTIGAIGDGLVVSDGDAAGSVTRFASTAEAVDRMLRALLADEFSLITAEILAHKSYPLEEIALIGVANDKTRDAVKELLRDAGISPKIAVHPPWFVETSSD